MATQLSYHLHVRLSFNESVRPRGLSTYCCILFKEAQQIAKKQPLVSPIAYLRARYKDDSYVRTGAILTGYSPAEAQLEEIIAEYDKATADAAQWQAQRDELYCLEWAGL